MHQTETDTTSETGTTSNTAIFNALEPQHSRGTPRVLIIDDDAASRLALAAAVREGGYALFFSTGAAEVRRRLDYIDPDVIICDVMMDDLRGDEFIRWLREHNKGRFVPVIAVTQLDNPLVRVDLLDSGADAVLAKSAVRRELRAYVAAALRTRSIFVQHCHG